MYMYAVKYIEDGARLSGLIALNIRVFFWAQATVQDKENAFLLRGNCRLKPYYGGLFEKMSAE